MAFLPDTNLWISLLKNPGGKLDAKVRSQPVPEILHLKRNNHAIRG